MAVPCIINGCHGQLEEEGDMCSHGHDQMTGDQAGALNSCSNPACRTCNRPLESHTPEQTRACSNRLN